MSAFFTSDGWYSNAVRVDAHTGRIGGTIAPETITVHTTDTLPGTTATIIKSWSTTDGSRACAHFIIDRAGKITQMVSIYRNANHVGGFPIHGWFMTTTGDVHDLGVNIHPNTLAVGIEVENAGYLGRDTPGGFVHPDTKHAIADIDVQVDSRGIGWHKPTEVQLGALLQLVRDLDATIKPARPGLTCKPDGDYKSNMVPWAEGKGARVHGHASLDPVNKTDPGPFILERLRAEGLIPR